MFAGGDEVDKAFQEMLAFYTGTQPVEEFLRSLQSFQKCDGWANDPLRGKVLAAHKTMKE